MNSLVEDEEKLAEQSSDDNDNSGEADCAQELEIKDEGKKQELEAMLSRLPESFLAEALARKSVERVGGHQVKVVQTVSQEFSGPLPPPKLLDDYEQVQSGFADRIVSMAEREQAHRQLMEKTAITGAIENDKRGQRYALYCSLLVIAGSMGLIYTGHQWAGGIFGVGSVTGLAYIFVTGRKKSAGKTDNELDGE